MTDTTKEAVERLASSLKILGWKKEAATLRQLLTERDAEKARADGLEEELGEERAWWPRWGQEIKAILERYGVDYSFTDEINLPSDLEDWIAEWTESDRTKQADLQSQLTAANEKLASAEVALLKVKAFAKEMRKSQRLVGPSEYQGRPTLMNVWTRTRYHDGKDILELIRATHPTTPANHEGQS